MQASRQIPEIGHTKAALRKKQPWAHTLNSLRLTDRSDHIHKQIIGSKKWAPERNALGIKTPFLCVLKVGQRSLQSTVKEGSQRDGAWGTLFEIKELCLWKEGGYSFLKQCFLVVADYNCCFNAFLESPAKSKHETMRTAKARPSEENL